MLILTFILWTDAQISARDYKFQVAKGVITKIEDGIIELNKERILYPAMEIKTPDWAVPGKKAALSYIYENNRNCYYEVVKPGEKLLVKDELEKLQKTSN